MVYYCKKCKYELKKEKLPDRCPYCSAVDSLAIKESAQDILESVFSDMDDISHSRTQRGY